MSILALMGIAALVGADSVKTNYTRKQKCKTLHDQGRFRPTSYERFHMIYSDMFDDWYSGERKFYPKEYEMYFERNDKARAAYTAGLVTQQEASEGLRPVCGNFNILDFHPFEAFHENYDNYIKIFNEIGRLYF